MDNGLVEVNFGQGVRMYYHRNFTAQIEKLSKTKWQLTITRNNNVANEDGIFPTLGNATSYLYDYAEDEPF